jgi:hypothetical protein
MGNGYPMGPTGGGLISTLPALEGIGLFHSLCSFEGHDVGGWVAVAHGRSQVAGRSSAIVMHH